MGNIELLRRIRAMAEEQVLYMESQSNMKPSDIIRQYTGAEINNANHNDAVESIIQFNTAAAIRYGFLA